jgi:zinc protease
MASSLGFWWALSSVDYFMTYVDDVMGVTRDDITNFANRYIVRRPRVSGVLISPEARASIGLTEAQLLTGIVP